MRLENSVNVILEESANMTSIIQTLLNLSKIEAGLVEAQKSKFFVSNLFAKIREEFTIIHKNLKIKIEDENFTEIESDERLLHQILTALVSNSVKFAGETCTIILRCMKGKALPSGKQGKTRIEVQDDGAGFAPEILPFVFERFYKGEKSHTRNGSGAGLGLSIAKALTQKLGGTIEAHNADGGGAVVSVTI